jgi:hypothetical protein
MKMSKQTAVSQIFAQIKAARKDTKFWNDSMLVDWLLESEERFKQMEQEQIEEAWNSAGGGDAYSWGKDYYNANYGETKN